MLSLQFLEQQSILNNPNENGIIVFILGVLFIISIYHFILYFQLKTKVYLYYSMYTFLTFISYLDVVENGFIPVLVKPFVSTLNYYSTNLVWLYNAFYFIFLIEFIKIKEYSIKWHKFILYAAFSLIAYPFLIEILYLITKNVAVVNNANILFTVLISILTLLVYYPLFKVNNRLKYYAIIGSLLLFTTSIIATLIYLLELLPDENEMRFSIFYFGVVLENIFFSLGLGKYQKIIQDEKEKSQKELISELKKNKQLQQSINLELEKNLEFANLKAEKEEFNKIKAVYDKQLAEQELYALRSQMNPHFVFNSLNSIQYYITQNELELSEKYLVRFSKLIRMFFEFSSHKTITIQQEINLLNGYLEIEKMRFGEEFNFFIKVNEKLKKQTQKIPTMLLQPIVENAVNHGVFHNKKEGIITVLFDYISEKEFSVIIKDNGIGIEKAQKIKANSKRNHKSKSIEILKNRILLLNDSKQWEITYKSTSSSYTDKQGTKVLLTFTEL